MKRIAAITTHYAGRKFRSRVEARWAVFFDACGIAWEYEFEGFHLRSGAYLPDFWLPELHLFFEVKGEGPSDLERAKCAELAMETGSVVLLGVGSPQERFQIHWFDHGGEDEDRLWVIARDRRDGGGYWLVGDDTEGTSRWLGGGDLTGSAPRYGPMFSGVLEEAYAAALSAGFEREARKQRRQPKLIPQTETEAA